MGLNTYEVNEDIIFAAHENLKKGKVILFAISGKMGSGKDTIGDLAIEKLSEKYPSFIDLSFGKLIRDEVNHIQSRHQKFDDEKFGTELQVLSEEMNVDLMDIKQLLQIIGNDNVYQRSDRARRALQFWGDTRRNLDPDYWIKSLDGEITRQLANSYSVNVTDIRFPGEVELIERFPNGKIVRLEVNEDIRIERMRRRDGIEVDSRALNHRTETVLDGYKFERTFNNEKDVDLVVNEVIEYLAKDDGDVR